MTNTSWKMFVNDRHFLKMSVNHQHFGSKRWLMTFIFPCTLTHLYECFSLKVCVCYSSVGVTRRSISARPIFAASVTNINIFLEKCLSMTNIFALNVGQWMFICPEMKDNHVLHFISPLRMFCLGHADLSLHVRPHRACCVLYRHNPMAVFGSAGDQHSLKNVCQCPTFLGRCLSMTNISLRMSVNDQHFLKNTCQWPTFLENCLSITNILAVNVG